MSNAVFVNIVSMTHYTLELNNTFISNGYKISDDFTSTFCDVWETMDEFLSVIGIDKPVPGEELAKALIKHIVKDGPDLAKETVVAGVKLKMPFYICDQYYEWWEVNKMW